MHNLELLVNNHHFREPLTKEEAADVKIALGIKHNNITAIVAIARALRARAPVNLPIDQKWRLGPKTVGIGPSARSPSAVDIDGKTLFGDRISLWTSIITHYGRRQMPPSAVQFLGRPAIDFASASANSTAADVGNTGSEAFIAWFDESVRALWAAGAQLLLDDRKPAAAKSRVLIDHLVTEYAAKSARTLVGTVAVGSSGRTSGAFEQSPKLGADGFRLRLRIGEPGTDVKIGTPVYWDATAVGGRPNGAILGAAGTGKTYLARDLVLQMAAQSGTKFLIIDPQGQICEKMPDLVAAIGAEIVNVGRQPLPLDLLRRHGDEPTYQAAQAFVDAFARAAPASNQLGNKQRPVLADVLDTLLQAGLPISLEDLHEAVVDRQGTDKPDSLQLGLQHWSKLRVFAPELSASDFFSRSWVINLQNAHEDARRLATLLIFTAYHSYFTSLGDAPTDSNACRAMRSMLVVDEAKTYLKMKGGMLGRIVAELGKRGCGTLILSQEPADFDTQEADFMANLTMMASFATPTKPSTTMKNLFGKSDLTHQPGGVCTVWLRARRDPVRVQAWLPRA